jgi:ketosteroid isomerase-like protein
MSEQNRDIIRRAHEAWNNDEFETARSLLHPQCVWRTPPDMFMGLEELYHGHDGFRRWWDAGKEPWASFESHIERILELDDRIVTLVRLEGVGRTSGAEVQLRFANVWVVEDGLITRFSGYHTLEEALQAEGLSGRRSPGGGQ